MLSSVTLPSTLAVLANCAWAGAAVPSEINRAMTTRGAQTRERSILGTNLIANPPTCAVAAWARRNEVSTRAIVDGRRAAGCEYYGVCTAFATISNTCSPFEPIPFETIQRVG